MWELTISLHRLQAPWRTARCRPPIAIPDTPGYEVDLGLAGKLVVNEQIPVEGADKGLTVNAVHLTTPAGADVVIGSSTSSAHDRVRIAVRTHFCAYTLLCVHTVGAHVCDRWGP
ncbi:choice-of-anchor P family protein [Streptomyces sp. NPDC059037]|uniref:choice-of-anchor P family protein n=1 Tax=Streptomyces sp. NPDC059037 TaxID=3346710 RepID=UPI0036C2F639